MWQKPCTVDHGRRERQGMGRSGMARLVVRALPPAVQEVGALPICSEATTGVPVQVQCMEVVTAQQLLAPRAGLPWGQLVAARALPPAMLAGHGLQLLTIWSGESQIKKKG